LAAIRAFGARRGVAVVGAGFKGDIGGGALGQRSGLFQRADLGMGAAAGLGPATPDDQAITDQNAAHRRVGPEYCPSPARQGAGHGPCGLRRSLVASRTGAEFRDEAVKVIRGLEVLVNAGKADIGDRVDPGEDSITISPMILEEMSVSPKDSSRRTMPEIIWSMRSGSMGRFCIAMRIERSSFERSKSSRLPEDLMTTRSRSWTRS
jgi:hypothetical protein